MDDDQLIDFERKKMEAPKSKVPRKAFTDIQETSKKAFFEDDPWVEYIDEFGRTRLLRQSEARELQASDGEIFSDDEAAVKREQERDEWEREREERNKGLPQLRTVSNPSRSHSLRCRARSSNRESN